jgi:hypothetical protein
MKWTTLKDGEELRDRDIVACRRRDGRIDFALGYPGWNANNNGVIARMPIQNIAQNSKGWRSEYRGDEPPQKSGWYLASLTYIQTQQLPLGEGVSELYYDAQKSRWLAEPKDKEIFAYMPFPKPYQSKKTKVD